MFCSICRHPRQAEMIVDYAYTCSLRVTAKRFGAGYRSLQRHLEHCIPYVMAEQEQKEYEREFAEISELLRLNFQAHLKRQNRKSIIKKPVQFTWSRRAWQGKKDTNVSREKKCHRKKINQGLLNR